MSGSGREALPNVGEWSVVPPGCPGVIEWYSRISGSGREALPDVRESPEVVGRPFRMSGSGRETLTEDWERLGGPP